jgi:hypothetical protein
MEKSVVNGKEISALDRRRSLQREFWSQLLIRSKNKTKLFENHSPGNEKYLNMGAGKTGLFYQYIIISDGARVEIYISRKDANWNKYIFDSLLDKKMEIEESFGEKLTWDRVDDKQASYIRFYLNGLGLKDKEKWPELQDQMINAMIRLEKTFQPFIKQLI